MSLLRWHFFVWKNRLTINRTYSTIYKTRVQKENKIEEVDVNGYKEKRSTYEI